MYRVRQQIGYDMQFFNQENTNNYAVCIVDSGIVNHPDLEKQVIAFCDFSSDKTIHYSDSYGHGTHVAGCLAGNGMLSKGRYHGICPNAKLVVLKVLDKEGRGEAKWLIEALRFILHNYKKYNIKVVNISLGVEKEVNADIMNIIFKFIDEILSREIMVVCAAGNYGPKNNTIYGIGTLEDVITVGCYDGIFDNKQTNSCQMYSGRGDKTSNIIKPDIVAPGTKIISCCNKVTYSRRRGYYNAYVEKSGTSMAAPIVSGVIMGFFINYPNILCKEVKEKLYRATIDIGYEKTMQGKGFIDCRKIIDKGKTVMT